MSCIAIIPARGGSVRIPRKNIKLFHGQPMLWYPIQAARASGLFRRIIVSTDDAQIDAIAQQCGAEPFMRYPDDGTRGTQDVAREVLLTLPDVMEACVIYPCSPLLLPEDLILSREDLQPEFDYVMSVQADPLADAGCFYWGWNQSFVDGVPLIGQNTRMYPLPPERCCDINTPDDWSRAEKLYEAMRNG